MPHKGGFLKESQARLAPGAHIPSIQIQCATGFTEPPAYLTEGELVDLMDKHGIGTDASILILGLSRWAYVLRFDDVGLAGCFSTLVEIV